MSYEQILKEIEEKARRVDQIGAEVYTGSYLDPGYGKGHITGTHSEDGVTFGYWENRAWKSASDECNYLIPFFWLEMHEDDLREMLTGSRREQEEDFAQAKAEKEAKRKALIEAQEKATFAMLKAKYES